MKCNKITSKQERLQVRFPRLIPLMCGVCVFSLCLPVFSPGSLPTPTGHRCQCGWLFISRWWPCDRPANSPGCDIAFRPSQLGSFRGQDKWIDLVLYYYSNVYFTFIYFQVKLSRSIKACFSPSVLSCYYFSPRLCSPPGAFSASLSHSIFPGLFVICGV